MYFETGDKTLLVPVDKKDSIQKLREQELSLDMQSRAIHEMLVRLDKSFEAKQKSRTREMSKETFDIFRNTLVRHECDSQIESGYPENKNNAGDSTEHEVKHIRDSRADAIKQRIMQRAEALQTMEAVRLKALEQARRTETAAIATAHYFQKNGWRFLQLLYHSAHLRRKYNLCALKANQNARLDALLTLRGTVEYLTQNRRKLRRAAFYHGWKLFRRQHSERMCNKLRTMGNYVVLHQYRMEKHCRKLLRELLQATIRRRRTNAEMDLFCDQRALRVALARVKALSARSITTDMAVIRHVHRRDRVVLLKALHCLSSFATRAVRARAVAAVQDGKKALVFLQQLARNQESGRIVERAAVAGESMFYYRSLSRAVDVWKAHWRRRRSTENSQCLTSRHLDGRWSHTQRRAVACFQMWLHKHRVASKVRQLCAQHLARAAFKLFHFWRQVAHIRAIKQRSRRTRVRRIRLIKAWSLLMERFNARMQCIVVMTSAYRAARQYLRRKWMRWALVILEANVQRRRVLGHSRRPRGVPTVYQLKTAREFFALLRKALKWRRHLRQASRVGKHRRVLTVFQSQKAHEFFVLLRETARRRRHLRQASRIGKHKLFCRILSRLSNPAQLQLKVRYHGALNKKQTLARNACFAKWLTAFQQRRRYARHYAVGRSAHRHRLLRGALADWIQRCSDKLSVAQARPSRVKLCCARRRTFLKKWIDATATRTEYKAYLRAVQRAHHQRLLQRAMRTLVQEHRLRREITGYIRHYRAHIQAPLLQSRFFRALRHLVARRRVCSSGSGHRAECALHSALRLWKSSLSTRLSAKEGAKVADRSNASRRTVQGFSQWRAHKTTVSAQRKNFTLAVRYNRIIACGPVLTALLQYRLSHQLQRRASSTAAFYKVEKAWSTVQTRWRPFVVRRKAAKTMISQGRLLYSHNMLSKLFAAHLEYTRRRQKFRSMRRQAKDLHDHTLLRKCFQGLCAYWKEGDLPLQRAAVLCDMWSLRRAVRRLRKCVSNSRSVRRSAVSHIRSVSRRAIRSWWAVRHRAVLALRTSALKATLQFRARYLTKYLALWWQHVEARRAIDKSVRLEQKQKVMARRLELATQLKHFALRRALRFLRINKRHRHFEKETVAAVTAAMDQFRKRQAFTEWRWWLADKLSLQRVVHDGIEQVEDGRLISVFPALARNAFVRKALRRGGDFYTEKVLCQAWATWRRYAHVLVKRVKHCRLRFRLPRTKSSLTCISEMTLDAVTVDSAYLDEFLLNTDSASAAAGAADCPDYALSEYTEVVPEVAYLEHGGDFRVSTQHRRIKEAAKSHDSSTKYHALQYWVYRHVTSKRHRRIVSFMALKRYRRLFRRLRNWPTRKRCSRHTLRKAWRKYAAAACRRAFSRFLEVIALNRASAAVQRRSLLSLWKQWRARHRTLTVCRAVLQRARKTVNHHHLALAFSEWTRSTTIERVAEEQVVRVAGRKMTAVVSALAANRRRRKKQRSWQLRSRRYQTDRWLRSVYTALLRHIEVKYNSLDQVRAAYRYYLHYQCRAVLHNLGFLRRNRISRDFNIRKQFGVFKNALRVNAAVVMFNKSQMRNGTKLLMRKLMDRLWRHAKRSKARSVHRTLKYVAPVTGVRKCAKVRNAVCRFHEANLMSRHLWYMFHRIKFLRRSKTRVRKCVQRHQTCAVFAAFRRLLSYSRMRDLKRRNIAQLESIQLRLGARRWFSALFMRLVARRSKPEHERLIDLHAKERVVCRGLRALRWYADYQQVVAACESEQKSDEGVAANRDDEDEEVEEVHTYRSTDSLFADLRHQY